MAFKATPIYLFLGGDEVAYKYLMVFIDNQPFE
jgi:hypothetical protein